LCRKRERERQRQSGWTGENKRQTKHVVVASVAAMGEGRVSGKGATAELTWDKGSESLMNEERGVGIKEAGEGEVG